MNQDFHYNGTFFAALEAGFDAEEARSISLADQMVDDCTRAYLKEINQLNLNSVVTSEGTWESIADLTENTKRDVNNAELSRIRKVWIPFHFLPGNLDRHYAYHGESISNVVDSDRTNRDMKCLCVHNSPLVQFMIEDTKVCYEDQYLDRAQKLALIGVRMHVLADTWAHEFFAGTPNYWINHVKDLEIVNGDYSATDPFGTPAIPKKYSIFYLGHARAGHCPDFGNLVYRYHPNWMQAVVL